MKNDCKFIAENGECLKLTDAKKRFQRPYYCGMTEAEAESCALYEKKEAQPKKIDVVEEMDRQEHEEFLDEYYPREEAKP